MHQYTVYYVGTANKVTEYPIIAKSPKEAKMLAITAAKLNPLIIGRLTAKKYN
jgi:hypothetical protein